MRLSRILSTYVLREVVQYAGIGILAVGSILLTQNLLRQLDDLTGIGLGLGDTLSILYCLVAMLAAYAIPVAFLFGVLVAMGRLSADFEITAMRALGVSLAQLATPFVLLGLGVSAVTGLLLYDIEPGARRQLREVIKDVAARGGVIQPGTFTRLDRKGERLLFVEGRRDEGGLTGVVIADRTDPANPFTVMAESGRFSFDRESATAHLELEQGDIHFEPTEVTSQSYRRIQFARFDYSFDMNAELGSGYDRLRPREMTTEEIRGVISHFEEKGDAPEIVRVKTRERYEIQLHRRLALPVAPVLFALVGIPLGLQRSRGARSWGVLICVGLVFGYYALLSAGTYMAEEQTLPAWVSIWIPNVVFSAVAAVLLYRARSAEL